MVLLVIVEVMLVLGKPISNPEKIMLEDTRNIGGFRYLIMSAHHTPWRYQGVGIIQLVLMMIINLMLLMDMIKVVWVLIPLIFIP